MRTPGHERKHTDGPSRGGTRLEGPEGERREAEDHGRTADKPSQLTGRAWKDILWRVNDKISNHNLAMVAGGIAFFAMLAMFPALIALVSLYGLVFSPGEVEQQIQAASSVLPAEAREVLTSYLKSLVSGSGAKLGWGAALGIGGALFSASAGMEKLMQAVSIAYDEPNDRGMIKQRALALALTLAAILAVVVAIASVAVLPAVLGFVQLGGFADALIRYGRWPVLGLLVVLGLAVLYQVAPHRNRAKWRWVSWGSAVATLLWVVASIGLSVYVSNFSSYDETYGAIGGVIVLMLWLYLSAFVLLLGAAVNAEMEARTRRDSTVAPDEPMGRRGAVKADQLGEARHN